MSASSSLAQAQPLGDDPQRQLPPRTLTGLSYTRLLLGSGLSLFAWIWLIFGSLFGWIFLQRIDSGALFFKSGPIASVPGRISEVWREDSTIGGTPIYAHRYDFVPPGSQQRYSGVSYSTDGFDPGQAVAVDYRADDPANSRIRGMGQAPFGPWNLIWAAGMPLIGLALIGWALRTSIVRIRLVTGGLLARTRLVSSDRTRFELNEKPTYMLVFRYTCQRGDDHLIKWRTNDQQIGSDPRASSVLYNPQRPDEALLIASLPAPIMVDASGHVELGSPATNLAAMVFPLIAMLISGFLLASLVR